MTIEKILRPIAKLNPTSLKHVRVLLTDMDETLTFRGRLSAATYQALEDLQRSGVKVVINTAAPAGWCDQMARMWPVDGVIGENGGLFFRRDGAEGVVREFWHEDQAAAKLRLKGLAEDILGRHPRLAFADDQPYRETSLAFRRGLDQRLQSDLLSSFRALGAQATLNNLWLLVWLGDYDKLAMARRILKDHFGLDIDQDNSQVVYVGDSENDGPMFEFFEHTFGVSTVIEALDRLVAPPNWITPGPGGQGFVEVVTKVIEGLRA